MKNKEEDCTMEIILFALALIAFIIISIKF